MAHQQGECCHPSPAGHHGSDCCGVGFGGEFHRRFTSREEVVARLESYLAELRAEAKAVEERIADLKKAR